VSRRPLAAAAGVVAALSAPAAASAAQYTVSAVEGSRFSAKDLFVNQGDSVVFSNEDNPNSHNVKFDDGSFEEPATPMPDRWRTSPKTFPAPRVFRYYCEAHGGPGGSGMAGSITVLSPGQAPGQAPGQTLTPAPPALDSLRARQGKGNSIVVRVDPSYESTATLTIARRVGRRYRRVHRLRRKLRRATRITVRRDSRRRALKEGRYRVTGQLSDGPRKGPAKNAFVSLR
jgi:plastocyanin